MANLTDRTPRGRRPVVMLTNAIAPDKLGGLERYVRELSGRLVAADVDVTIVTKQVDAAHPVSEIGEDGVRIIRHTVPSKRDPLFAVKYPLSVGQGVLRELRERDGAILHGHYAITTLPVTLPGQAAKHPYLYTFHAPVHKEMLSMHEGTYLLPQVVRRPAVAALRAAESRVATGARRAIVLSDFMRDEFAALDRRGNTEIQVVAGGVDTDWFTPQGKVFRDPGDAPVLFTARRLTARTGVAELIESVPRLRSVFPGLKLFVAGDGNLRRQIQAKIVGLGLEDAVTLLGRVSEEELRDRYRQADLTVMPTQELEGFGLTTAESMSCGTPVIVTPAGANPELVRELSPDLVTPGTTPGAIADGIAALLKNPGELRRVHLLAREYAYARWSWDTVVNTHTSIYAEL